MLKSINKCILLVTLLGLDGEALSFDLATHMYIASQTFDIWEGFDSEFYDTLIVDNEWGMLTRKFYYIGTTLPDLLDTTTQSGIRRLITRLGEERGGFWGLVGPLYIEDEIKDLVQTPLLFNAPHPNRNLKKLREMVLYAKEQGWHPVFKALIYGAYMHVVQDLYAHMMLQPSRYGYGYAVESDSAFNLGGYPVGLLFYEENYYEAFTPTYISDWSFIETLYKGTMWSGGNFYGFVRGSMEFYFKVRTNGSIIARWQDMDFDAVSKFVEAATACGYNNGTLTRERLESYLHGWAMAIFLTMGYRSGGVDIGGMLSHPGWSFEQILDFWVDIGDAYWQLCDVPIICDLIQEIAWPYLRNLLMEVISEVFDYCIGSDPWPSYFETPSGFEDLWSCVPPQSRPEEYYDFKRMLEFYYQYSDIKKPNLRSTYSGELERAIDLFPLMEQTLVEGSSYLDYSMDGVDVNALGKKSGLLGGMYEILNEYYYDQPGVIKLHFERGSNLIYTTQDIEREGPATYLKLSYDLVTFGDTKVLIKAETGDSLASTTFSGPSRETGTLTFNAQDAVNEGVWG